MNNLSEIYNALKSSWGNEIESLFNNDDVTEIMLNTNKTLWIETFSKGAIKTNIEFTEKQVLAISHILGSYVGQEINYTSPSLAGELPITGHRFQIDIPPIVSFPTFNFRKKATKIFTLEEYCKHEIITNEQFEYIKKIVKERKNILIVGGTGSGKTTLTNAILNEIAKYNQRIIILEDTQELQCSAENQVFYKTSKTISMKQLIQITMRKTPERIVVGEIREGYSALGLLKTWNSGHEGGISTIHANTAILGLEKLEQYIEEVSVNSQKKLIASVTNVVIVISKINLKRKISRILEINGINEKNDYVFKEVK